MNMNEVSFTCDTCVFKEIDEQGNQSGCLLGRIDQYEKQNCTITKDKNYTVSGKIGCSSKRNSSWKSAQKSLDEQIVDVKSEHAISYDLILYEDIGENYGADLDWHLDRRIGELNSLKILPKSIILVRKEDLKVSKKSTVQILQRSKLPFNFIEVKKVNFNGDLIDEAYLSTTQPYIWIANVVGSLTYLDVPQLLNEKICNFERILLLYDEPNTEQSLELIISGSLFETLKGYNKAEKEDGSTTSDIIEKTRILAKDQNNLELIRTYDEIRPRIFSTLS